MVTRGARSRGAAMVLAGLVLATGCGSGGSSSRPAPSGSAKVRIVASTDVYGDIASQIAGAGASVTSIITNPDADPHSYEANPRNQLELAKADVVIENGGGYDDFVDTMLKAADNTDATVLDVVDISGHTAPNGGELNEHVWYDFGSIDKLTDRLVTVLSSADPGDAATFRSNAATFRSRLDALEATEASIKRAHQGDGVAITEPVPLYLLEACGLVNETPAAFSKAVEDGTGVSAVVLEETLGLFSSRAVKLLAYNEQTSGPETQKVLDAAKANGVAAVPVTETLPSGKDYIGWMRGNLSAVQAALG